jgi:hypothetical protein
MNLQIAQGYRVVSQLTEFSLELNPRGTAQWRQSQTIQFLSRSSALWSIIHHGDCDWEVTAPKHTGWSKWASNGPPRRQTSQTSRPSQQSPCFTMRTWSYDRPTSRYTLRWMGNPYWILTLDTLRPTWGHGQPSYRHATGQCEDQALSIDLFLDNTDASIQSLYLRFSFQSEFE